MTKETTLKMNLQRFARPTFNPDTTTMQDAKTGSIPITISEEIITEGKNGSAIMKLAKAIPMDKPEQEFTFMTGVGAYWVDEAERIQTSKPSFVKAKMSAHKMAVIIPTTKENLKYSVTNFFELMKPEITEAFHKKFDHAAFSGVDSPFKWSVKKSATDAGQVLTETANKYDDISNAMGEIEQHDLDANAAATIKAQKRKYRGTKDENGLPIFNAGTANAPDTLVGLPLAYTHKGAFGDADITELVGNWDHARYGILSGIEYEILTEATLTTVTDEQGNPLSLAERDMAAIKATFSIGFMITKDEAFAAVVTESKETEGNSEVPEV